MGKLRPTVDDICVAAGVKSMPIATTAVVYTNAVRLSGEYFSLSYKAGSSGVVALKIELEQAVVAPTTENAADTNYVVAEDAQDIESALADEVWHHKRIGPITLPWARLKITGGATNDASTVLQAKLTSQQEI